MTLSLAETYERLRSGVVGVVRDCEVVLVRGPDAESYLQGQCSQDVSGLAVGASTESLLLSPQGKLELLIRIARSADDAYVVEVPFGYGEIAYERLRRFKLRVKAELVLEQWRVAEVRGDFERPVDGAPFGASYVADVSWPGLRGFDLVGPNATLPNGVDEGDLLAFEVARIEAGMPRLGAELTEKTIPQEAGLVERTVSFTKGCFTGQELVARLDARGSNVPRHLRGLVFSPAASPRVGDEVLAGERVVGVLTSVARSPRTGSPVALGYLRRELSFPSEVLVRATEGAEASTATAVELPITSDESSSI